MKAISLHRPWDLLVLLDWKRIETRFHRRFKSLVGLTIAIHSAKRIDRNWKEFTKRWLSESQQRQIDRSILDGGRVHGTVEVWDHRPLNGHDSRAALIDCSEGNRHGLDLAHPRIFRKPVPVVGRQGIFEVAVPTYNYAYLDGSVLELLK